MSVRSIKVSELKPGNRFSEPVYIDGDSLLVPEGIPIREKDLQRLKKWGIEEVTTEGRLLADAAGSGRKDFIEQNFASPEQKRVVQTYDKQCETLRGIHSRIRNQDPVDPSEVDKIVDALFRLLDDVKNQVIEFVLYGVQGEGALAENAINSAVLTTMVGQQLQMPKYRLIHLATAALLHDVGMLRLPKEILDKQGELTSEENRLVRTHPIHSYKIITRELKYPEEVGLAALQHQERWDGKGYPKHISGQNIILGARIIAVVDSFEAMVSTRPYRSSMIGYQAMRNLLSDNSRRFDPNVLKVFIRTLGIYPIGSVVLLNNSCIARVIENNSDAPLKPKVRVIIDQHGREKQPQGGEIIDLFTSKDVFIAKAVDPKNATANQ
jgi:HD-GYP domain-containing protein (c-di-GMP phosphodiesterase class II)